MRVSSPPYYSAYFELFLRILNIEGVPVVAIDSELKLVRKEAETYGSLRTEYVKSNQFLILRSVWNFDGEVIYGKAPLREVR